MIDNITDDQIITAAEKHLRIRQTDILETLDVYYMLQGSWKGYRGRKSSQRAVTLHRIARVLLNRGYVVVGRRGGYAIYRKGGDNNDYCPVDTQRMDDPEDKGNTRRR